MAFQKKEKVAISPANMQVAKFKLIGDIYVANKFAMEVQQQIKDKQEAGSTAKRGTRKAKDFDAACKGALHISPDGWCGLPASAFRNGLISACRLVGFPMTKAKLSIFVLADGWDVDGFTPLVRFTKGEWERFDAPVRNATGVVDIRSRPKFGPGWEATLTVRFDADQFTLEDVTNLLARMGEQVGIGAGRPDSTDSAGCGWGTFRLGEATK